MERVTIDRLTDEQLREKRVLVRVDFNVPLEEGRVVDDTRIRATLPTLDYLLEKKARIILVSHLGRPGGKRDPRYSLAPAAERLQELINAPVGFVDDVVGEDARTAVKALNPGEVLVLENVRFLDGEERNDAELGKALAALAHVYVNDAFGAAHRAHSSTVAVAEAMRREQRPAVAGILMERELRYLGEALQAPEKPFVALLGGAKISGKIEVIENLLPRVDRLLCGGAMANTFFRALGLETGTSLVEEDRVDVARDLLGRAGSKLVLPVDGVIAAEAAAGAETWIVERDSVPEDKRIMDIGPKSAAVFSEFIQSAETILWNGPMGMFELPEFRKGTEAVARAVAGATEAGATSIIGGGDTVAALHAAGLSENVSHVSTGGGASLEFLEGKVLPGVAALDTH